MIQLIDEFKKYSPVPGTKLKHLVKLPEHAELYQKLFEGFPEEKQIRLLEIGIYSGASMEVWKTFFGKRADIFGIDIKDHVNNTYGISEKHIDGLGVAFYGDQAHPPFMAEIAKNLRALDIVIDDGGHWCDEQQISFNALWPIMRKGGVYVIEDLWVAKDRVLDGYECTIDFLDKLDIRKEWYKGFHDFEKDICVLYKE